MAGIKNTFILSMLIVLCISLFIPAEEAVKINPEDSIVLVISKLPAGMRLGNGFVIGDGTLVVTAHHLVFEKSEQGKHQMPGLVRVFSPYLGDVCEGEIITADKELDLAVIKLTWLGHPALKLVDDNQITLLEEVEIIGMPALIRSFASEAGDSFIKKLNFSHERLPVDFVAVRRQIPRFISLSRTGTLGPGWSGAPMLLPETSEVIGSFVSVYRTKENDTLSAQGPAMSQVRTLAEKAGKAEFSFPAGKLLLRAANGPDIFLLAIEAYRHYLRDEYNLAFEQAQKLMEVRPESTFACGLAAIALEKQNKPEQAEQYYLKAIELDSEGIIPKLNYAQFLSESQPDKALEILNQVWQFDNFKPSVSMLMFNILYKRDEHQRCCELLSEAINVNPDNAYLWINLGACQLKLAKTDDAIASITKSVELLPERGPFRGQLARLLEQNGKLEEAEKHFRELLKIETYNPVVHFWLAQFLAKHRPDAREEALKEAQIALNLPSKGRIPRQIIEKLIAELQSHTGQESSK